MKVSVLLAALAGAASASTARSAVLPPALKQALAAYDDAQMKGDRKALQRLLADDYLLINSTGSTETKAEFIRDLTSPTYKLNPFVVIEPVQRVWNGGAINGGITRLSGVESGKPFDVCLQFSDIWARNPSGWQVALTHVSKPDPSRCPAKPGR